MTSKQRFFTILILGLLSAVGPFSIDMYLPGFKAIADDLNTNVARIQLSLTTFFIGIAVGQMVYGPLLDRFGRKKPLIIGLIIYIAASIGCALVQTADGLIIYRFIQALGACGGLVASKTMVRDYFPPADTAKIFSMLMLVIGISPILAPTIGGYVTTYTDWHVIFVILAAFTCLILAGVLWFLPESRGANPQLSLKPLPTLKNFWAVLRMRQFYTFALAGGFASSGLYAYLAGSPFVMMDLFGVSEQQYGWIFALLASALITSSQVNRLALKHFSSAQVARMALLFQSLTGILLLVLTLTGAIGLYGTIILVFVFLGCQGFVFPNTSAMALNPFSKLAGSASSLMGSLQMSVGAFSSALVSFLHNYTAIPMTAVMAGCSLCSLFFLLMAPQRTLPKPGLS